MPWGVYYMPQVYNGDDRTAWAHTTLSGLSFASSVTFWAGATQGLDKGTVAIALSPDAKFWTRPEFRL